MRAIELHTAAAVMDGGRGVSRVCGPVVVGEGRRTYCSPGGLALGFISLRPPFDLDGYDAAITLRWRVGTHKQVNKGDGA